MPNLRDVVVLQKRELESKLAERYIERETELPGMTSNLIKVIIGPRRAGKSFFAIHRIAKLGRFGYVNFDDERLLDVKNYDDIINAVKTVYQNPTLLLFDEIQNLDRWEVFVNRLQRQGYNLVITGSNSNLLSRELATHLTGRHLALVIFPFSFNEYIKMERSELTKSEIKERLFSYIRNGGYPEPIINKLDTKTYLSTLFDSIIYKDVVKRYKIRSIEGMDDLALYLISNIANEFSYSTLAKVTGCKSIHTVEKYLNYLEETFVLFKIPRFSFKVKEQVGSNKKIYCVDNGFIHAKAFRLSPDMGKLYENAVAIELKKLELSGKINLYYWKSSSQEEVDFVLKQGTRIRQLIQVCYSIDDAKTKRREVRALVKASKETRCNNLTVITDDYEGREDSEWFGTRRKITFIPLWKWLLGKKIP
ncbi:MAG: ATP-binding protein [Candidatus Anstonellales archaeon]